MKVVELRNTLMINLRHQIILIKLILIAILLMQLHSLQPLKLIKCRFKKVSLFDQRKRINII